MVPLAGIFTIVFWGIVALLLVILYAIARFYQITSGQSSRYGWFAAPVVLLSAGALRYAARGDFTGDALGDALMFAGGVTLIALAAGLLRLMMGGRR